MRRITIAILSCFICFAVFSQDITGQWNGVLKLPGLQLRLVFSVNKTDTGYQSTMDSPDQGAKGIPVNLTSFENGILKFIVSAAGIEYQGTLGKDNIVVGQFKQRGQSIPLDLSREAIQTQKPVRPQEPVKPYPYHEEEIRFENAAAGVTLAGTLSFPKKEGSFPVVVLISGSGPQNRDEELLGHKPFLVLSDYLSRNGFAVLRFDDRGTASSTGDFNAATTLDFASDVEAAVKYLHTRKEVNKKKIGLIGHSEGGMIAPMVASRLKSIAFIVLLAAPGIPGDQLLLLQQESIAKASGVSNADIVKSSEQNKGAFDIVRNTTSSKKLKTDLAEYIRKIGVEYNQKPAGMSEDAYVEMQVAQIVSPWMIYFLRYNPAAVLEKVNCPVLAINGKKDLQVPPKENLDGIKTALQKGGNKNVLIKELPGLNHLFQECKTGLPTEYAVNEQTFSPIALTEVLSWLQKQTK